MVKPCLKSTSYFCKITKSSLPFSVCFPALSPHTHTHLSLVLCGVLFRSTILPEQSSKFTSNSTYLHTQHFALFQDLDTLPPLPISFPPAPSPLIKILRLCSQSQSAELWENWSPCAMAWHILWSVMQWISTAKQRLPSSVRTTDLSPRRDEGQVMRKRKWTKTATGVTEQRLLTFGIATELLVEDFYQSMQATLFSTRRISGQTVKPYISHFERILWSTHKAWNSSPSLKDHSSLVTRNRVLAEQRKVSPFVRATIHMSKSVLFLKIHWGI